MWHPELLIHNLKGRLVTNDEVVVSCDVVDDGPHEGKEEHYKANGG